MTDDDKALVERLRPEYLIVEQWYSAMLQAADRIEALTAEFEQIRKSLVDASDALCAENERLRSALEEIAAPARIMVGPYEDMYVLWRALAVERIDIARKALESEQ